MVWSLYLLLGKEKKRDSGNEVRLAAVDVFAATRSKFSRMFDPGDEFSVVTRDAGALE